MGHRADFVIIENGRARCYYDHWGALGCTFMLTDGAKHLIGYARSCEETDTLMEWAWAEAGWLLDRDEHLCIAFGEPDPGIAEDAPEAFVSRIQRSMAAFREGPLAYFAHMATAWKGWTLQWDERGTDAFAEHLRRRGITTLQLPAKAQPDAPKPGPRVAISKHGSLSEITSKPPKRSKPATKRAKPATRSKRPAKRSKPSKARSGRKLSR